jgi:ribose transport system substrate-binding protein
VSKQKTIEFIPTSAIPYFNSEYSGIQAEAAKYGYKTVEQAPASDANFADQISMVRTAVSDRVSGIILVPFSPTALVSSVKGAEAAGIPVIATDSTLTPMVAKSFIAVNDVAAAEAAAQYAVNAVGGKGEYAIIDYNLSTSSGVDRRNGFLDVMKKHSGMKYEGIQIDNEDSSVALSETTTLLERNPKINVVFAANDSSALGVAQAVSRLKMQNKVTVVAFDADLGEINYIKSGVIKASALQAPTTMGMQAVDALHSLFAGKKIATSIPVPYHLVTHKNYGTKASISAIAQYIAGYKG